MWQYVCQHFLTPQSVSGALWHRELRYIRLDTHSLGGYVHPGVFKWILITDFFLTGSNHQPGSGGIHVSGCFSKYKSSSLCHKIVSLVNEFPPFCLRFATKGSLIFWGSTDRKTELHFIHISYQYVFTRERQQLERAEPRLWKRSYVEACVSSECFSDHH